MMLHQSTIVMAVAREQPWDSERAAVDPLPEGS